jgi:predicted O-linked N-acetylglucosamine transferase (SPINDLY family)
LALLNPDRTPEIRPLYAQTCNLLAFCLREMGDAGQAADLYSQSLQILPRGTTAVAMNTLLAPVYPNHAAMTRWRETFRAGLANLEAHPADLLSAPMQELPPLPFYLAYQGDDVRSDLERFGNLFRPYLPAEMLLTRQPGERLRVAVVTQTLYTHSVMLFFARLLIALPPEAIELCLVTTSHPPQDPLTTALQARADQFVCVPPRLEDLRRAVATLTADVIIYPDLGMDPLTYFLAHTRLAPVQGVWTGHPVTTGLPTIDAFFTWGPAEPEGAEGHYSEPLVRCQAPPWQYAFPQLPSGFKDRRALGLPELGNLYVCPCTLFKVHPDMDAIFQAIIDHDRKAFIVLIGDPGSPALQSQLQARFQRTVTRKPQRIRFIPWLKGDDFYHLLAAADVVLDPLHFSGGNVTYQAFAVGTPVVTWPGHFLRGRMTSTLYQTLGRPEPVATDPSDYARRAVAIATDPELRGMLKHTLLQHRETLFHREDAGPEITDWLLRLSRR